MIKKRIESIQTVNGQAFIEGDRNPIYDGKLSIIEKCTWRKKPDGGFIIISHDEKPFTKYYDVTPQAIALIEYTKDF